MKFKLLLLILFICFLKPNLTFPQATVLSPEPIFFLFGWAHLNFDQRPKNIKEVDTYFENLTQKLNQTSKNKKISWGAGTEVIVPQALLNNDVIPKTGDVLYKLISGPGSYHPEKCQVKDLYLTIDAFNGHQIFFSTENDKNSSDQIFVLLPNEKSTIEQVLHSFLPIAQTENVIDKAARAYKEIHPEIDSSKKAVDWKNNFELTQSFSIGNPAIKIISLLKTSDTLLENYSIFDFGDKILIKEGWNLDRIIRINGFLYFVMTTADTGNATTAVFKLVGQSLEKTYSDDMVID